MRPASTPPPPVYGVDAMVKAAPHLWALYVPPSVPIPGEFIEERLQLIVADEPVARVTLLPPHRRMEQAISDRSDRLILALEPQLLDRRVLSAGPQDAWDPYLYRIATTIRLGFRAHCEPPAAFLDSLATDIAGHLNANYPVNRRQRERRGLSDNRLARALALIEERLAEPLAVNEIAEAVHLSAFHFARMFRRSTGMSPHEYVTTRRVEKAQTLLAVSDVPLAEVAQRVGYRTQAHFTRVFHEKTGTTPRRYRQSLRKA